MKEGQSSIYYMAADSKQAAESAPFTEQLVAKGYEVLICCTHQHQMPDSAPADYPTQG